MSIRSYVVAVALLLAVPAWGKDFHVAPTGTAGGDGSAAKPWTLAAALAGPAGVAPGDTIWLHGGTYAGSYSSKLTGAPGKPITVRAVSGERATIDGKGSSSTTLTLNGAWAIYWGFEVTNSDTNRWGPRPEGVYVGGKELKLVNLVIHDGGNNGFWAPAENLELYGCLFYNQGYDESDRGHGHALYTQNQTGTKRIVDNILWGGYSFGIHAYTEGGFIEGYEIVGNTWFNAGVASSVSGHKDDCLVGGLKPADRILLRENMSWAPTGKTRTVQLGYGAAPNGSLKLEDNYFVGEVNLSKPWTTVTITGNTFYSSLAGVDPKLYPQNTYLTAAPTTPKVFVRPNLYEPGRAHVIVYNWGGAQTVDVDLSKVLKVGASYEVRDAQNVFAAPVKAGTYPGGAVALPMTGLTPAQPVGSPGQIKPANYTGAAFNVFVVIGGAAPPAGDAGPGKGDVGPSGLEAGVPGDARARELGASAPDRTSSPDPASGDARPGASVDDGCGCAVGARGEGSTLAGLLLALVLRSRRRGRIPPRERLAP